MTYLSELKKWNRAYNLTSLKTDEDIIIKHFLDSLLYLKAMPQGEIRVMDVGSGAGFPGIPIKIVRPEVEMYLVEPKRKKAAFLRHMTHILGINNIEVVEKRVEDLESMDVDVAVTRALFDIRDFCKKLSPVLERGGILILSKGPKVNEEIRTLGKTDLDCRALTTTVPLTDIKRYIVVIKKSAPEKSEQDIRKTSASYLATNICFNVECRLRKAGCRGFEGCPGFKVRP
ncbi:MAG: 16S rRNA (guanine(527)-N(7))-methyltransferase RsmG [Thermodesulfovibrionales bacterium]